MEIQVVKFAVYEDSALYQGIAKATLPDLTYKKQTVSGIGLSGDIDVPSPGQIEAMTMALDFLVTTLETIKLSKPEQHIIDLRIAQQDVDSVAGGSSIKALKHVLVVYPEKTTGGSLAPSSASNASIEFAVHSWSTFIDGVMVQEIDPVHNRCYIDGIDYLSPVQSALGQ